MGKEKGFALSPVRARDLRGFLERNGYRVVPGQHKHFKLRHEPHAEVLLPLRPGDNLSHVAVKQIAAALGGMLARSGVDVTLLDQWPAHTADDDDAQSASSLRGSAAQLQLCLDLVGADL
jgi:predicted RNA binding protein YcfA (HicA-like mRNA interferase family)